MGGGIGRQRARKWPGQMPGIGKRRTDTSLHSNILQHISFSTHYYQQPQFVVDALSCRTVCHQNKDVRSACGGHGAWAVCEDFSPTSLNVLLCQTCPAGLLFLSHLSPHDTDPRWFHSRTGISTTLIPAMNVCVSKRNKHLYTQKQKNLISLYNLNWLWTPYWGAISVRPWNLYISWTPKLKFIL